MTLLAFMDGQAELVAPTTPDDSLNMTFAGPLTAAAQPAWHHIIHVGPDREIKTVQDGVAKARTTPYARKSTPATGSYNVASRGGRVAHARTLVLLDPGAYPVHGILDAGDGIDLMGNGDTPGDVVIQTDADPDSRYPLRFWGSMYAANLTLHHTNAPRSANNYPMHGSTVPGTKHFTAVFDNVHFLEDCDVAMGIAGWDMPNGMRAFHYRCRFESLTGKGIIYHDMAGSTEGVEATFIECAADADFPLPPGALGTDRTYGVRYDCTTLDGLPLSNIVGTKDSGTGYLTEPFDGPRPALPEGAITQAELAKYEPLAPAGARLAPDYGTVAPAAIEPDRTYYIPLGELSTAALVSHLELTVRDAGSGVAAALYVGTVDKPTSPLNWPRFSTSTGTVKFWNPDQNGIFMEREDFRFWMGVRAKASAVVDCSTTVAALYEDGGSDWSGAKLWPAPTGEVGIGAPVPAVSVIAKR